MQHRFLTPELMDEPGLDPALHAQALRGLRRLNAISDAAKPVTLAAFSMMHRAGASPAQARIADIATGGADLLLALAKAKIGSAITGLLTGIDISQTALEIARQRAAELDIRANFINADVLAEPLPIDDQAFDIAVCSLFLHHLDDQNVVAVLREMARISRVGIIVSDLRRSHTGLALAAVASRVLSRSRIVHIDSVKSVRAAWNEPELANLASQAGLAGASVQRIWPQRMLLTWERP